MRQFIYKTIIIIVALVVAFEFTIGKTINKLNQKVEMVFTKEGRKGMVITVKNEMQNSQQLDEALEQLNDGLNIYEKEVLEKKKLKHSKYFNKN